MSRTLRVLTTLLFATALVGGLSACDTDRQDCPAGALPMDQQQACEQQHNGPAWNGYPSYGYGTYG